MLLEQYFLNEYAMSSLAPFILLIQMFVTYKYFGTVAWYPGCLVRIDEQMQSGAVIEKRCSTVFTVRDAYSFKLCTLL